MTRQQGLQRRTGGNIVGGCEGTSLVTTPPLQLLSFLSIRVFLVGLFLVSCIFFINIYNTDVTVVLGYAYVVKASDNGRPYINKGCLLTNVVLWLFGLLMCMAMFISRTRRMYALRI